MIVWDSEDQHTNMALQLGGAMVCFHAQFSAIALTIINGLFKTE